MVYNSQEYIVLCGKVAALWTQLRRRKAQFYHSEHSIDQMFTTKLISVAMMDYH